MGFLNRVKKRNLTPENIGTPDPSEPKWLLIEGSEIWANEISPFIETLRDAAILKLLAADIKDVEKLQGEVNTYIKLMEYPARAARLERDRLAKLAEEEQEEEEHESRRGASWLTRVGRRLGGNTGTTG